MPRGIHFELEGDSNDYLGKGLSGGTYCGCPTRRINLQARRKHHCRQYLRYMVPPAGRPISAELPVNDLP
ncbi:MAG: hypothetical protein MZV65_45220 [Chromatiales bacterium]|nr:hypothetical protein [Chromatiales bacterium]